jgi:hypothetical protein
MADTIHIAPAKQQAGRGGVGGKKKTPSQGGRQVVEAGFIQARNLSSSGTLIQNQWPIAKPKIQVQALAGMV